MNQSTFVLDTRDLGRSPGAMRQVQRQVTFDQDLGSSVIAVPAGEAIELDLRLEAVMEGVLVTGQASTHARGERSEEHTSELQSRGHLVCRLLLEKKKEKYQKVRER